MRDVEAVQALLTPYPAEQMIAYPVSMLVSNAANDTSECIVPLA